MHRAKHTVMFRICRVVVGLLSTVAACAAASPAPPRQAVDEVPVISSARSLAPHGEPLSPLTRAAFTQRMHLHRDRMGALTIALGMADYERIVAVSERLANEPLIGKPAQLGDDPLLPQLPANFFMYQRELQQSSAMLVGAARARDDARIAEAFSGLAHCCAGCHAAYVHEAVAAPALESTPN